MTTTQIIKSVRMQFGELIFNTTVENRLEELGYTPETLDAAVTKHYCKTDSENPAIYCGTYKKYNNGSLAGLWIDITSFNNYDEFIKFCNAIHADEQYPELMAQDFENFPRKYYNEGFISQDDFDRILEYHQLCEQYSKEAVNDYVDLNDSIDNFEEAYCGEWNSESDFARHIVDECYNVEKLMGNLSMYFDYEAFGRDLFLTDYDMSENGHVFRCA